MYIVLEIFEARNKKLVEKIGCACDIAGLVVQGVGWDAAVLNKA